MYAIFQQYLHMEYISLRWYNFPELVVPIRIFLIHGFTVAIMTWLTVIENLCHKWPRICSLVVHTSRSFHQSWFITGFLTRFTRQVPLVEQELLTLPDYMSPPPVFSGVCVTRSLVLCVCFVDRCLLFFGHCVVRPSSVYEFSLPLWYLQTLLTKILYQHEWTFVYQNSLI